MCISGGIPVNYQQRRPEKTTCTPKHNPKRDGTVDDVIDDWSSKIKCPCLKNIPYGHIKNRCVLPIGGHVQLNADKKIINIL